MLFECVKQAGSDGWAVEAIDFGRDGQVARVLFIGLDDEFLAKEYCDWKNSSTQPHAGQIEEIRRAAVLAERERSPWKAALDQELVSLHLGTTDTPGYDTPKAALDAIIQWHVKIALDPAVSSDAAALIAAERERCAKVCEGVRVEIRACR